MANGAKAGKAIREKEDRLVVNGEDFMYAPPTVDAIIEFSEGLEELPTIIATEIDEQYVELLAKATECRIIGIMIAKLIVGEYIHKKYIDKVIEPRWWEIWKKPNTIREEEPYDSVITRLSNMLLRGLSPLDLYGLYIRMLTRIQVHEFHQLFFSLNEINLLKPTKTTRTTQSGQ